MSWLWFWILIVLFPPELAGGASSSARKRPPFVREPVERTR